MISNRRSLLKTLATAAVVLPVAGTAQDGASPIPGFSPATGLGPLGVWAFINAAKAAVRSGPNAVAEVFQGADSNLDSASLFRQAVWSEASPLVLIRESVHMTTPGVATIDAEIGRFHTVGGWEGAHLWIVLERRAQGATETWKPVLARLYANDSRVTIFSAPRNQFL